MKINLRQLINPEVEILEISALKARQMSLQAGIIPDHNTNWKGALKKVRGARGELISGKELNQIKQKMGFPENNVLQKLKSTERKLPALSEVGYDNRNKEIIKSDLKGAMDPTEEQFRHNQNQVGFIHTHPYVNKKFKEKFNIRNLDRPSGLNPKIINYNNAISSKHDFTLGDVNTYKDYPSSKFPIYAPSENSVSVSRVFNKDLKPGLKQRDENIIKKYNIDDAKFSRKMERYLKVLQATPHDNIKYNDYNSRFVSKLRDGPSKPSLNNELDYKMNHVRFIVGKDNYGNFNLNGEKIK